MPFTREGISPDLIINPHCIPSRMTVGHLIECLLSKVSALMGTEGDATPFEEVTVPQISDLLHEAGYQKVGNEVMYNGHTGRRLTSQVFFGPTYYQRLKHMVEDKIHARARGPLQIMTRQPTEGRGRDGGLRFGEMERDCMIAHGAAMFLQERLMTVSDRYRVHVCDRCGMLAIANLTTHAYFCKSCHNTSQFSQELMAMQIAPRLMTSAESEQDKTQQRILAELLATAQAAQAVPAAAATSETQQQQDAFAQLDDVVYPTYRPTYPLPHLPTTCILTPSYLLLTPQENDIDFEPEEAETSAGSSSNVPPQQVSQEQQQQETPMPMQDDDDKGDEGDGPTEDELAAAYGY
ncbi:MAG: DNA-directed RNA polymerase II subunit RPB2 [Cercozoa sp. M6MM]